MARISFTRHLLISVSCICGIHALSAQMPQANRVSAHPDLTARTTLTGHVPRWATPENLQPKSPDLTAPMRLSVVLQRAPQVQAAFEQFLADQQNPASPAFHRWLTPQQVGDLYGPTQSDVAAITAWLTSQGLQIESVAPSRMIIEATGSGAVVGSAFRVNFGYYQLGGQQRLSTSTEPTIPAALQPVIRAVDGLADVPLDPGGHGGVGTVSQAGSGFSPQPLFTTSSGSHLITPGDFAAIYDVASIHSGGNTGATIGAKAQHIAVIDRSDVSATDISLWAANVGLASYNLNTIFATGVDPGMTANGDQLESTGDVNQTLGTANGAITDLVVAANANGGIFTAASYNVNTLVDPVMNISFYGCEANASATSTARWDTLFAAGAAEGISTFVCSGDSGAAGCASDFSAPPATTPVRSVNYICSSSYATCVGGTEFNDTANPSAYWSSSNATGRESAIGYIPEGAWNEAYQSGSYYVQSGGGGASIYITKPSWQAGTGVPADGARDQPDISFTSAIHDGYYSCLAYSGGDCSTSHYEYLGGTSFATPNMAAITALLNTKTGTAQGNINPLLYRLAASSPAIFNDVTVASSGVTSCSVSTASMCNNSTPSQTALTGGLAGYVVTAGYDQATGLGSLDAAKFIAAASATTPTTLTLSASASSLAIGQTATFTATVAPSSGAPVPTGTVQFLVDGVVFGTPVTISNGVATSGSESFSTSGKHSITATYSGDNNFAGSIAPALTVTVGGTFTLAPTSGSLSFTSGAVSGNADTINLSSLQGFIGAVALTCSLTTSSAAFQPACSVTPSVTLTSGGTASATVTITSTTAQASLTQPTVRGRSSTVVLAGISLLAISCLIVLPHSSRRRLHHLAVILSVALSLASLNGCSKSSPSTPVTPPVLRSSAGSYTVTINGSGTPTGSTVAVTASTTFTVTIN